MKIQPRCLKAATLALLATSTALCSFAQAALSSGPTSTVVYVGGDDLVLKAADGKLLNFTVPAGYHFSAGAKQLTLAELKPGTALTKPVATGTDPKLVSAVAVVKGKVYASTPPDAVTIALADGTKDFMVPAGTKFMVDGKAVSITDLKPDMMVEATVVTTAADAEKTAAATPATPPMKGTLLVAKTLGEGEAELPLAGTNLPLYGIAGFVLLAGGIGLMSFRKPAGQI